MYFIYLRAWLTQDFNLFWTLVTNITFFHSSEEILDNSTIIIETNPSPSDDLKECTEEQIIYSFEEEILEFVADCAETIEVTEESFGEDEVVTLGMELSPGTPHMHCDTTATISDTSQDNIAISIKHESIQHEPVTESRSNCDLLIENKSENSSHENKNDLSSVVSSDSSKASQVPSKMSSPVNEIVSPTKETVTVITPVLGKEQIKRRLQSFSLMKQGFQAVSFKKIIKHPKVITQLSTEDQYDENGEKLNEKHVVTKPASSKKGTIL